MMPRAAERDQRKRDGVVARKHGEIRRAPACRMVAICAMLPEASLTPTMLSIAASRASVAGSTFTPVRPCTL